MDRRNGLASKGVIAGALAALGLGLLASGFFGKAALPQSNPQSISVFFAPSRIEAGESWVLIGSLDGFPQDLVAAAASPLALVAEQVRLSAKAVAVRVEVQPGASGNLLEVSSGSATIESGPTLTLGTPPMSRTADVSFGERDFTERKLVVGGDFFMYGYLPAEGVSLAAVRIHNRATGAWTSNEIAAEKAREASEVATPINDPAFVQVDPFEALVDTDGDGVPDVAESPEEKPPVPEEFGVALSSGLNTLDLVAVDEAGNVSWRTIDVLRTSAP